MTSTSNRKEIIRHLRAEIASLESRLDGNNDLLQSLQDQLEAHETNRADERRTHIFRRAAIDITPDDGRPEFSDSPVPKFGHLSETLIALGERLDQKFAEVKALSEITERVNSGMFFDEVLGQVFENFGSLIPYDRIGVALIEKSAAGKPIVRSQWCRAKYEKVLLGEGYVGLMEGSSLAAIAASHQPRIINDLNTYLRQNPKSRSTSLIVSEGLRSSLTCPLVARDETIGFIFFSSCDEDAYYDQHVELFQQIAGELALTLEKSRAYEDLFLRNEFLRKVFGQYVTNEVAEAALRSDGPLTLGGERKQVTVLMADLRGFTPMSEILTPEEVVDALNVFLGAMTDIVMKHGGSIDNFIGDALMAVFGVPVSKPDDTARAVACAIEMQNAMVHVNSEIGGRGLPDLNMGIGLSTGEAVAGNIGSQMRLKYSVIGSTVNLSARIEAMAGAGQIFASKRTHDEVADQVASSGHLNVQLKGMSGPVPIYELIGIGEVRLGGNAT